MGVEKFGRLSSEFGWIVGGQVVSFVGSIFLVGILTRHLGPRQYGELALGLTIAGLVNQVITGPIANGMSRFWSFADEKGDIGGYLEASRRLFSYALIAVLIVGTLILFGLSILHLSRWVPLAAAALALSVASGTNAAMNGIQTAARQRPIVALQSAADAWLKIGLAVCLVAVFGPSSMVVAWAYVGSATAIALSQLFFLRRLVRSRIQAPPLPPSIHPWGDEMWRYSWPFAAWGAFTWLQASSDRWALQTFSSTDAVGIYAVLFQLGFVPISLGSGLLVTLLAPIMFQHAGDAVDLGRVRSVYRSTSSVAKVVFGLVVVAFALAFVLHGLIFDLLSTPQYRPFSHLMPWMALAAGFQACHHILGIRVSAWLKTRTLVLPQMTAACMFAALNAAGAYWGGIEGLVFCFVIASALHFTWMLVLSQHLLRGAEPSSRAGHHD